MLPNTEGLSSEKLNSNGIYLLHDLPTAQIFIWIGEHVNPRVCGILVLPVVYGARGVPGGGGGGGAPRVLGRGPLPLPPKGLPANS